MSTEERLLEAIDEDEEECETTESPDWREKQRRRLQQKNRVAINRFLGKGRRTNHVGILPRYYGELLTWALQRYLEREGWKITATLGYRGPSGLDSLLFMTGICAYLTSGWNLFSATTSGPFPMHEGPDSIVNLLFAIMSPRGCLHSPNSVHQPSPMAAKRVAVCAGQVINRAGDIKTP